MQPTMKKFFDHFQELIKSKRALTVHQLSFDNGPLKLYLKSLTRTSRIRSWGKLVVMITAVMRWYLKTNKNIKKVLHRLFNAILRSGEGIPDWALGMLVPIYKDGPKLDPANYRGITLISCLGKLFLLIINNNNRLIEFAKEKKLCSPSQLGFVRGNCCSDTHIIRPR